MRSQAATTFAHGFGCEFVNAITGGHDLRPRFRLWFVNAIVRRTCELAYEKHAHGNAGAGVTNLRPTIFNVSEAARSCRTITGGHDLRPRFRLWFVNAIVRRTCELAYEKHAHGNVGAGAKNGLRDRFLLSLMLSRKRP